MMRLSCAIKAFFRELKAPQKTEVLAKEEKKLDNSEHLRLLYILQHSSRIVDFLKEDISGYQDAEVGLAVRQIHAECAKTLEDLIVIRPLMDAKEGSAMTVPKGYDPAEIKVTGRVKGEPPYKGVLRHAGWKAHKLSLPRPVGEVRKDILCPAEVEIVN
ncbi:MAG: DUF2760 domain-containing protein [Chlamydiales bacterium]|nr:DUF2760 domain-containing protein [Chlamydiales bacterium]